MKGIIGVGIVIMALCACSVPATTPFEQLSLAELQQKRVIGKVYTLSEGLQAVVLNEDNDFRMGFFDVSGKQVIPFKFYPASDEAQIVFSSGLAPARTSLDFAAKNMGFINHNGVWVIKPQFFHATSFYGGVASIGIDNKHYGYIKPDGSYFVKPIYDLVYYFPLDNICVFKDEVQNKWGLCRPDGTITVQPIYEGLESVFEGKTVAILNRKAGFIDIWGNKVTEFVYDAARGFMNGTAIVYSRTGGGGIIDAQGKLLFPLRKGVEFKISSDYVYLLDFKGYSEFPEWFPNPVVNGVLVATDIHTGLDGLMNLRGEWVTQPKYHNLHYAGNNQFKYQTPGQQVKIIGVNGKEIQ